MIEYRELFATDIESCITLQKKIFGLSDIDTISPLILRLISRDLPPLGISMGVFKTNSEKTEMLGFIIGLATFYEKSIYVTLMGVSPEFQNSVYGYKLLLNFREVAISKGLETMYCIFEPLESNLARLYCHSLGFRVIKYIYDTSQESFPADKMFVKWDLNSNHTLNKIKRIQQIDEQQLQEIHIIHNTNSNSLSKIRIEIPDDFIKLKTQFPDEAKIWRKKTRELLNEYINNKDFIVTDCVSIKSSQDKSYFYILEKIDRHELPIKFT